MRRPWLLFKPDPDRIAFGMRTAAATWLAVVIATMLHIPNAQWAGITVFVVAQPTRGMIIEKGFYRIVGSAIGTAAGVTMLLLFGGEPKAMIVALAVWLGGCAGVGALLRHFRSYGAVLAGYTAAIIALLAFEHPDTVRELAFGRVASTAIGIALAAGVMSFTPPSPLRSLLKRSRRVALETLDWAAAMSAGRLAPAQNAGARTLALRLGEIEAVSDEVFDGSQGGRRAKQRMRDSFAALLALIAATRAMASRLAMETDSPEIRAWRLDVAAALRKAIARGRGVSSSQQHRLASLVAMLKSVPPTRVYLDDTLQAMIDAVHAVADNEHRLEGSDTGHTPRLFLQQQGSTGAFRAAARTALAVLAVGGIWLLTDWEVGPIMMLGTCVMATAFSSNENNKDVMRKVIAGVSTGIAAAMLFRLVLMPDGSPVWQLMLAVGPFMLLSGIGLSSRLLMISAVEYNNIFLLFSQPNHSVMIGPPLYEVGGALLLGVCIAMLAYHFIFPVDASANRTILKTLVVRDLENLARSGGNARQPAVWRARQYHRLLRLAAPPAKAWNAADPIDGGLAVLEIGNLLLTLSTYTPTLPPGAQSVLASVRSALGHISLQPQDAVAALRAAASQCERLAPGAPEAPVLLALAAEMRRTALTVESLADFWTV